METTKMTNTDEAPPLFHPLSSSPSFSSLPDEIVVSCLARIPRSHYRSLLLVSKSFYYLLSSPEMYSARSQIGATVPCLYVCLWLPKPKSQRSWFTLMNPAEGESSLAPVRFSSSYAPVGLDSTTVTVGFEIYKIGGTVANKLTIAVRVLDCRNHTWRRAPALLVARKGAKSCFLDGKIYVIGGCRKRKRSMIWGEVLDIKTQTWKPLSSPSDNNGLDPSDHEVVVLGGRLYVITKHDKYAYDPKEGRWLLEMGFAGLEEPIISRPFCVIENVVFAAHGGKYKWYDSRPGMWSVVKNLDILYAKHPRKNRTIQLVNYSGKLVILLHEELMTINCWGQIRTQYMRIWCAVIRLEKRLSSSGSEEIWGELECCNVVVPTVPKYKLLSCLSVSV
ncbi:hypothetical protein EUTSA_v10026886mg [Eutrema salsugineum]|uniref:F-box domain-containing protein n=1 Tax=Eutrema salsugineum TaxID=72664 RepID=V4LSN1_EUTSA|nr:putative F-box/kelch-repeat protein At4g35120 [Eutrema salsugineum]ESQ53600.1 hypothetical protein EUTSA_v10026886mg [Eutrema salsugineum]